MGSASVFPLSSPGKLPQCRDFFLKLTTRDLSTRVGAGRQPSLTQATKGIKAKDEKGFRIKINSVLGKKRSASFSTEPRSCATFNFCSEAFISSKYFLLQQVLL